MDPASLGRDLIVAAAGEHGPQRVGGGGVRLEGLRLSVEVRPGQVMDTGYAALFIGEIDASTREGRRGATVTCVGMGSDLQSAVGDAVGQWVLGVLPVLARWRGEHTCLSSAGAIETRGGRFTLLAGPTLMRGRSPDEAGPAGTGEPFWKAVEPLLRGRPLGRRVHWLELFASKSGDGEADATCRLNNRDWAEGRTALLGVASAWPAPEEPLQTCRQFVLLVPTDGGAGELTPPSFWDRLRSRA